MSKNKRDMAYLFLFAVLYLGAEYIFAPKVMLSAGVLLVGGFILWRFATKHADIDPRTVIIPYLLTVIAFMGHVYEEYHAFASG